MNVVRPAITSPQRRRLISCSVDASTDEVASSRIEDPRVGEDRAGDRDPLALAARERQAALADQRVVAVGERLDELVGLRELGRPLDLLARGVGARVGDVVVDRGREQERIVGDDRDRAPQASQVDRADVGAVDPDRPAVAS